MKKLLQIVMAAAVCASLAVGVAAAQSNSSTNECDIYQTDSSSYNSCLSNTNNSVRVTCENDTYVIDNNSQQAGTGNATITGNGSGGYAASGSAENENGAKVTIGSSCGPQTSTAQTSKPTSSSKGAGTSPSAPTTPSSKTTIAASSLPETGSNTVVNDAVIGAGALFGALALSYVTNALVRRAALK